MSRKSGAVIAVGLFIMGSPLVARAQTPTSITLVPSTICGKNPAARVNLSGPAPASGLVIQLSSSIPAAASVPASITAGAGATSASFLVTCVQIAQSMAVNISATANGATQTALINVLPPVLNAITVDTHTGLSSSVNGRASLTAPAPPSGQIVTLLRSGPISVPQSVTVPAGAASATFTVTIHSVQQPTTATITGTGGVTKSVDMTVMPPAPSAPLAFLGGFSPATSRTITGGRKQAVGVTIGGVAPAGGLKVQLSSSNAAVATIPATMTVSQGQTSGTFSVSTVPVAQSSPVTITASVGSVSKSGVLTVAPPTLDQFGVQTGTVIGGQSSQGRVFPTGPAPPGGLTVQLSSNNTPLALVPPSVTVPAGADMATFNIATFPTERPINVTITASAGGVTRSAQITVVPEGPTSLTISPNRVLGSAQSQGTLNALASNDAFTVSLSSDNPLVVTIPRSVSFTPGVTAKHFTITTKPVAQQTRVRISATTTSSKSGATSISRPGSGFSVTRTDELTIDPPKITGFTISRASVVGGSNTPVTGTVTLNGPAPTGFPITVSSSDHGAAHATSLVAFPSGGTTGTFSIGTGQVPVDKTVTIRVSNGGLSRAESLWVTR